MNKISKNVSILKLARIKATALKLSDRSSVLAIPDLRAPIAAKTSMNVTLLASALPKGSVPISWDLSPVLVIQDLLDLSVN